MLKRVRSRLIPLLFILCFLALLVFSTVLQNIPVRASSLTASEISIPQNGDNLSAEIIDRARTWTSAHVQYSQSAPYYPDAIAGYRRDSSGFVSMAWGIPPNLITKAPHGLTTEELYVISDPVQQVSQLQPGDILLNLDHVDHFDHTVIFNGWTDAKGHPIKYNAQNPPAYYDGLEENGNEPDYGYAVEHIIPYPYYEAYGASNYMAQRFDAVKASNLNYIPNRPTGAWVQPGPKDGSTVTNDTLHFAVTAYPTHKADPAIATVYFTIGVDGMQYVVCSPTEPSMSGNVYTCDVNLKKLGFPPGQMQASFSVVDTENNVNLVPEGVHTFTYAPPGTATSTAQPTQQPGKSTATPAQSQPPTSQQPAPPQQSAPTQPPVTHPSTPMPTPAPKPTSPPPTPTPAPPPPPTQPPAPPPPTQPPAPPKPVICASAPSDGNCTNQDPVVDGCSGDAYNVTISYIRGAGGATIGEIDLRYSTVCHSNWGRLITYSTCGHSHLVANVTRPSQGAFGYAQEPYTINNPGCRSNLEMYTNIVYAPGSTKAQACGTIDSYTGCTILT